MTPRTSRGWSGPGCDARENQSEPSLPDGVWLVRRRRCHEQVDVCDGHPIPDVAGTLAQADQLGHRGRPPRLVGVLGAVEDVDMDEARRQFEVNVVGAMNLTRLVLPTCGRRSRGRS